MKKNFVSLLSQAIACGIAIIATFALSSCSSDEKEPSTPSPQTFTGSFTTSIPSMTDFEVIEGTNTALITWDNPQQSSCTVKMGAFTISMSTPMGERAYEIGEMTIANVQCSATNGAISMNKSDFECQAGDFLTTGSLSGTLHDGVLTITLLYKPGSMPFDVQSIFIGK